MPDDDPEESRQVRRAEYELSGVSPEPQLPRRDEGAAQLEFELAAARLAAERRSAADAERLVHEAGVVALAHEHGGEIQSAAHAFRQALGRAAHNPLLARALDHLSAKAIVRDSALLATHYPIVANAIVQRDADRAEDAVRALFDGARRLELRELIDRTRGVGRSGSAD